MSTKRSESGDRDHPEAKRQKLDDNSEPVPQEAEVAEESDKTSAVEVKEKTNESNVEDDISALPNFETLLPPSRSLLGASRNSLAKSEGHTLEFDVGISEYISKDLPPMHAIIKQRYA